MNLKAALFVLISLLLLNTQVSSCTKENDKSHPMQETDAQVPAASPERLPVPWWIAIQSPPPTKESSPPPSPAKVSPPPPAANFSPPPPIYNPVSPPPPPVYSTVSPPTVKPFPSSPPQPQTRKDCIPLCLARCKIHLRRHLCLRACVTCCDRCKCVPPGQYGNREICGKCYTNMSTHGGMPKCP